MTPRRRNDEQQSSGRWRRGWAALAVMGLVLAGCAADPDTADPGEPPTDGDPTTPPDTAPSGSMTIGLSAGWDVLDPAATAFTLARQVMAFIYDPLLNRHPETGEIVAGLAQDWSVSDDGTEITLTLRDGVTFHDGTQLDAEAVVFSLERIADPDLQSPLAQTIAGPVESIAATGDLTLVITLREPFAPFLDSLAQISLAPVSPTAVEQFGADYGSNPVGTGPFRLVSEIPNEEIVLEANEDYAWAPDFYSHQGPPRIAEIVIRNIEEDSTRIALAEGGDIDFVYAPLPARVEEFRDHTDFYLVEGVRPGMPRSLLLNTASGPFEDPLVRLAAAHAVDKQQILDAAFQGLGTVMHTVLTPTIDGFSEAVAGEAPEHSPDRAAELLEEAGWELGADGVRTKDGQRLSISQATTSGIRFESTAQIVQSNLAAVGFETEIEILEQAAYFEAIRGGHVDIAAMLFPSTDADVAFTILHSEQIGAGWNTAQYVNPEMDALLEAGRTTTDPDERRAIYEDVQRIVVEDTPYIPYLAETSVYIISQRIRDVGIDQQAFFDLYEAWIDDGG